MTNIVGPRAFIKEALDKIWNAGHTPRIIVDSTHTDVQVPDFVRARWGSQLPIDLDARWPLNIDCGEVALQADLAFDGVMERCNLPWHRIYAIVDRDTGAGVLIKAHSPLANVEPLAPPPRKMADVMTIRPPVKISPAKTPDQQAPPTRPWTPRVIKGGKAN